MQAESAAAPSGRAAGESLVLVSLATYNEAGNIGRLVRDVRAALPAAHILIVDDGSPDGTGTIADGLAAADTRVHVLHRKSKLGLGTALLTAMRHAMAGGYDYLLNMDADFSHPPRYLSDLVRGMRRHDVMIGSRYVHGGGTVNWPRSRLAISLAVNVLVRLLFRMPVKDASGGFRCYRVGLLRRARLDRMRSEGYSFQQEVLFRCYQAGGRLGETPIIFENRQAGVSKVDWREALRSLSMLIWLGSRFFLGAERRANRSGHTPRLALDPVGTCRRTPSSKP